MILKPRFLLSILCCFCFVNFPYGQSLADIKQKVEQSMGFESEVSELALNYDVVHRFQGQEKKEFIRVLGPSHIIIETLQDSAVVSLVRNGYNYQMSIRGFYYPIDSEETKRNINGRNVIRGVWSALELDEGMELKASERKNGRQFYVITNTDNNRKVKILIAADTFLPHKKTVSYKRGSENVVVKTTFQAYKDVSGTKLPTKIVNQISVGNKELSEVLEFHNFLVVTEVDRSIFTIH